MLILVVSVMSLDLAGYIHKLMWVEEEKTNINKCECLLECSFFFFCIKYHMNATSIL